MLFRTHTIFLYTVLKLYFNTYISTIDLLIYERNEYIALYSSPEGVHMAQFVIAC